MRYDENPYPKNTPLCLRNRQVALTLSVRYNPPMKIVLATPIYPPEIGGPATYTKEICERLGKTHNITVVAYTHEGRAYGNAKLVEVEKNAPLPLRLMRFFFAVYREAKTADVIYAQNAVAAGLPSVIAGILRRKPVVIKFVGDEAWERATQHRTTTKRLEDFLVDPDTTLRTRLMLALQGWVLRHATRVTTPSVYLRDLIVRTYQVSENRAVTNYNASEEDTHEAPVFESVRAPHQIAMTARLTAWKGVDGAIRAMKSIRARYPDAKLVIAGDGPERTALETLTKELNATNSVSFLGNISRAETWQLREESEVYVLNSTYEGLPHTVLTSFAAGIPIVATNISGTNEAVIDEVNGLLIPTDNPDELAAAVIRYFDDASLRTRMIAGGHKTLEEKFSWSTHLANLEKLLAVRR